MHCHLNVEELRNKHLKMEEFESYTKKSEANKNEDQYYYNVIGEDHICDEHFPSERCSGNKKKTVECSPCRPVSARSNATSITLLGTESKNEELKYILSNVQEENIHLKSLISELRLRQAFEPDCQVLEDINIEKQQYLLDEINASQRKIRMNELELDKKEKLCYAKDKYICDLESTISQIKQQDQEKSSLVGSLKQERDHALQQLETNTQHWIERDSSIKRQLDVTRKTLQSDCDSLKQKNMSLLEKLKDANNENGILLFKLRNTKKQLKVFEKEHDSQQKHIVLTLEEAQHRINNLIKELSTCSETKDKLIYENELLQTMCVDLKEEQKCLKIQTNDNSMKVDHMMSENMSLKETNQWLQDVVTTLSSKNEATCNEPRKTALSTGCNTDENKEQCVFSVKIAALEDEKNMLSNQIIDLESLVSKSKLESRSLEQRLQDRTTCVTEKQIECATLVEENFELKKNISGLETEISSLKECVTNKDLKISASLTKLDHVYGLLHDKEKVSNDQIEYVSMKDQEYRNHLKQLKSDFESDKNVLEIQIDELQKEQHRNKATISSLEEQVVRLTKSLQDGNQSLQFFQEETKLLKIQEEKSNKVHDEALDSLRIKVQSSSEEVQQLEESLIKCKQDVETHVQQLYTSQINFENLISEKNLQIEELQTEINLKESLNFQISAQLLALQKEHIKNEKILETAAVNIDELHGCETNLQAQVSILEQQLLKAGAKSKSTIQEMQDKLHLAYHELEQKKQEYENLNSTLRKIEDEFSVSKCQLSSVEENQKELNEENLHLKQSLQKFQFEWKEMKMKLDKKIEEVAKSKEELDMSKRDLKKVNEIHLKKDEDLKILKGNFQNIEENNKLLLQSIDSYKQDIEQKQLVIKQLHEDLSLSEIEQKDKTEYVTRLENKLEERQLQLRQRTEQVSAIEVQVRELEGNSERCHWDLFTRLQKTQSELNERNKQVSEFDERVCNMRDEINELNNLLYDEKRRVDNFKTEQRKSERLLHDAEKACKEEKAAKEKINEQCEKLTKQITEKGQVEFKAYTECRQNVELYRKQIEQLCLHIDKLTKHGAAKDQRISQLSLLLSENATSKTITQEKLLKDLEKARNNTRNLQRKYDLEVDGLKNENLELTKRVTRLVNDQSAVQSEPEKCSTLKKCIAEQEQHSADPNRLLSHVNMHQLNGASPLGSNTSSIAPKMKQVLNEQERPVNEVALSRDIIGKTSLHHSANTTSLYAELDSEVASLAGSFVPITVTNANKSLEDELFFATSSPTQNEEHSLQFRVFTDHLESN